MSATPRSRKWLWWAVALVAVLVIAGIAWALSSPAEEGGFSFRNLFSADGTRTASDGATGTLPGDGTSMSTTSTAGKDGTKPGTTGGTAKPSAVTTPASTQQPTFYVRASWWNDTEDRAPVGFTVAWGTNGKWSPDPAAESAVATIGPFFVGKAQELKISPDGASGPSITVPMTIMPGMLPSSIQDGIHIEVRDDGLRVIGNPIENTERTYPRP